MTTLVTITFRNKKFSVELINRPKSICHHIKTLTQDRTITYILKPGEAISKLLRAGKTCENSSEIQKC